MLEKVEDRHLIQGIPIAITVLVRSPLSWSEDNKLAVVTQLGTYIFELTLTTDECSPVVLFTRAFIPPPSGPSPYDTGIDIKNLVEHVDQMTGHSLMLNGILSPSQRAHSEQDPRNVRNTSPAMPGGDTNHLGYRRDAWSPFGVGLEGRCVLALTTHDHRVSIFGRDGRHWKELLDLSAQWHRHVYEGSWARVPVSHNSPQLEKFTARMHMLAVAEMLWTPVYEDKRGRFSVLVISTVSGHVVFWRVPTNFSGSEGVEIIAVKETKISLITIIHWYSIADRSGYLITGNNSGQVGVFYCQLENGDVVLQDLGRAYDSKDRLRVNHIYLSSVADDQYLLLASKHNILLATTLNLTADNLTINHMSCSHVGKLAISGIVVLANKNVYVSVKDGSIQHISINILADGELHMEVLGSVFRSEGVSYTGLVTSPNKALWGILESVSVAYDHLVVREPTQITLYQVGCSSDMVQHVLESEHPLHRNTDLLESARISIHKDGMSPVIPLKAEEIPNTPIQIVKVHYWLAKMSRRIWVTDQAALEILDAIEPKLQTAILEHWITDVLCRFSESPLPSQPSMMLSLSLMCQWMKDNGTENLQIMAEVLVSKLGEVDQEVCLVCQEPVYIDSLTIGRCANGHTLPRCCRSFLLTKPTVRCPRCRVFAHKDAIYLVNEVSPTCTYCDGFVINELCGRSPPQPENSSNKPQFSTPVRSSKRVH